jgi:hypothetical protein
VAITFEQFKIVIADEEARRELGLSLDSDQAAVLLGNEARAISFFQNWNQMSPSSPAPQPVHVVLTPWSASAIVGFVLSIVGTVALTYRTATMVSIVGLIISATTISAIKDGYRRGTGLAIAGTVIAALTLLLVLLSTVTGFGRIY